MVRVDPACAGGLSWTVLAAAPLFFHLRATFPFTTSLFLHMATRAEVHSAQRDTGLSSEMPNVQMVQDCSISFAINIL